MARRTKRSIPQRNTNPFERYVQKMPKQVPDVNHPEYRNIERQGRMVDEADALLQRLPESVGKNPAAEIAADAIMTAKYLPTDRRAQVAAGGLLGLGLAGSGLQAYGELSEEYAPRDPLAVAGRTVRNLNPFTGGAGVGVDPLQEARNNVASAAKIVGTENVLEAIAADEINQMRAQNEVAMTPVELEGLTGVQAMIDARAQQLMSEPIQKSDGSVGPMGFDTAQRIATEQIAMELRAGQAY